MKRSCLHYFVFLICCIVSTTSLHAGWEATNSPFGNAIRCFYADGSTFIAGTYSHMYRSDDAGEHWNEVPGNFTVFTFCTVGEAIYAGTRDHGVIASYDDGKTWEEIGHPTPGTGVVSSMIFHDTRLYAGSAYNGVYISLDSGRTWASYTTGLPDYYYDAQFVVANDRLFIGIPNSFGGTDGGVFILDDDQWKPTTLRNIYGFSLSVVGSRLIAGSYNSLHISDDNGETWTEYTETIAPVYIKTVIQYGSSLFAGTDAGVWTSDDNGITWSPNVLSRERINLLAVTGTTLVAGTENAGILLTSNNGVSWTQKNNGLPSISSLSRLVSAKDRLYAIHEITGTIFRSTDQGITWQTLSSDPASTLEVYNNRLIISTRTGKILTSDDDGITWNTVDGDFSLLGFNVFIALDNTLLAGVFNSELFQGKGSGLLYSSDGGTSWSQADMRAHVYAFAQHGKRVFAGTTAGVYSSDDEGRTWTERNNNLPSGGEVYAMASNGKIVVASFFREGVYVSQDNGESWSRADDLPDNVRIDVLTAHGNNVFAGGAQGIFITVDNGQNWTPIDPALEQLVTLSLTTDDTYLYAGTKGRAVWRHPLAEFASTSVGEQTSTPAFSLYPQPMHEVVTLSLCDNCTVRDAVLTLTTLDGRIALTQPHVHGRSVTIYRAGLPAGTYVFTLRQNARTVASGIIVME